MTIPEGFSLNPVQSIEAFQQLNDDVQQEVLMQIWEEDSRRDLTSGTLTIVAQKRTYTFGPEGQDGRRAVLSIEPPHSNEIVQQRFMEAPVAFVGSPLYEDGVPRRLDDLIVKIGATMIQGTNGPEQRETRTIYAVLGINPPLTPEQSNPDQL